MRVKISIFIVLLCLTAACNKKKVSGQGIAILEVEGRFLYKDELDKVIPLNSSVLDSTDIADRYIKNWITQTLIYKNAERNIGNKPEIDKLVEEYRKALIIHEYEQALISERINSNIPENEVADFYNKYKTQQRLDDNLLKGVLLIVPNNAPQIDQVKEWVKTADNNALEKIEKYSLQNAISYDYFMDKWTPFAEIIKKAPFVYDDSRAFVLNNRFVEVADSTKHYFLNIHQAIPAGDTEPFEYAKENIASIMFNRKKTEFILSFEKNIYDDAIKKGNVNFIKKKKN